MVAGGRWASEACPRSTCIGLYPRKAAKRLPTGGRCDARNAVDEHAVLWFFACGVYEGKNLRDMCLDVVEVIEWDVQALNVGDGFWWVGCPAHVQQVSVFWIDGVWKGGDVEACNDFDG